MSELAQYYDRVLPVQDIYKWLNHTTSPTADWTHREFMFEIPPRQAGGKAWPLRYLSFSSADGLKRELKKYTPTRFEIGGVFTVEPRQAKTVPAAAYRPLSRELVFDIDMDDYEPYRTCCEGKTVCIKCWQFVVVAMTCLESLLRQDFGYEHILWAFSGRRGAHAWVCDPKARDLDERSRAALMDYIKLPKKLAPPYHPHVVRSYKICVEQFNSIILHQQNLYQVSAQRKKAAQADLDDARALVTDNQKAKEELVAAARERAEAKTAGDDLLENFCADVQSKMSFDFAAHTSAEIWKKLEAAIVGIKNEKLQKEQRDLLTVVVLEALYPKLDDGVSKQRNHMLKSPFCVHPGTDKICVPIDMKEYKNFDPDTVPKLTAVLEELQTNQHANKTSLGPYFDCFSQFVSLLLRNEKRPAASLDF